MTEAYVYQPPQQPKTHAQIHAEACERPKYYRKPSRVQRAEHIPSTGPLKHRLLMLWTPSTLAFRMDGYHGRYENILGSLVWRRIHE